MPELQTARGTIKERTAVDSYDATRAPTGMQFIEQPAGGPGPQTPMQPVRPVRPIRRPPRRPGGKPFVNPYNDSAYRQAQARYEEASDKWKEGGGIGPPPTAPAPPAQGRMGGRGLGRYGPEVPGQRRVEGQQQRDLLQQIVGYFRRGGAGGRGPYGTYQDPKAGGGRDMKGGGGWGAMKGGGGDMKGGGGTDPKAGAPVGNGNPPTMMTWGA